MPDNYRDMWAPYLLREDGSKYSRYETRFVAPRVFRVIRFDERDIINTQEHWTFTLPDKSNTGLRNVFAYLSEEQSWARPWASLSLAQLFVQLLHVDLSPRVFLYLAIGSSQAYGEYFQLKCGAILQCYEEILVNSGAWLHDGGSIYKKSEGGFEGSLSGLPG